MRREPALSSFPPGAGALFHYYHCTCSLFPLLRFRALARLAILHGNHRERYREGGETIPRKSKGMAYLAEREHPRKSNRRSPPAYTIFFGTQDSHTHTYLATASDYSGRFPPSTGNPGFEGCKKNKFIEYHNHSDFTLEHDVSRRKSPEGRTTKSSVNHEDNFALKGPKILLSYDFNTQSSSSLRPPAPPPHPDTRSFNTLVGTRAESVFSIYTHKHTHTHIIYIYPRTFHGQGKNSPAHAKNRKDSQTPLFKIQTTPFFSLPAQIFSVFLLPLLLSHIPRSSWDGLGGRAPGVHRHLFPISSQFFNFLIYSSFHFLSFLDLIICTFLDNFLNWVFSISSHPQPFSFLFFTPLTTCVLVR